MKTISVAERKAFLEICTNDAEYGERDGDGIGTYAEKSMHRILKSFYEPDRENREVSVGHFVADAKRGNDITEIQTASLSGMRDKLACFLDENNVRIVFPIEAERKLLWVDPRDGSVESSGRRAPGEDLVSLLEELIYILDYIPHPRLTVTAVYLSVEEYRRLDGYGKERKKRASLLTKIPTDIFGYDDFRTTEDYGVFVPDALKPTFTSDDMAKTLKRRGRRLWACKKFLEEMGFIERIGKEGIRYIYRLTEKYCNAEAVKNKNL